jgi:hypothetical protein
MLGGPVSPTAGAVGPTARFASASGRCSTPTSAPPSSTLRHCPPLRPRPPPVAEAMPPPPCYTISPLPATGPLPPPELLLWSESSPPPITPHSPPSLNQRRHRRPPPPLDNAPRRRIVSPAPPPQSPLGHSPPRPMEFSKLKCSYKQTWRSGLPACWRESRAPGPTLNYSPRSSKKEKKKRKGSHQFSHAALAARLHGRRRPARCRRGRFSGHLLVSIPYSVRRQPPRSALHPLPGNRPVCYPPTSSRNPCSPRPS